MPRRKLIFPLACLLVCTNPPTLAATPKTCPDGDFDCFERHQVAACYEPSTSTTETCRAWIHTLDQQASKGSSDAELRLAHASRALADLATDPAVQAKYNARARSIYRERIRRDADDAQALLALATLADDDEEMIGLLQRGVALAPEEAASTHLLASKLHKRNRPGDALAAAIYMERAYDAMKPERWAHHASSTHWYYQQAGANDLAARFRARVIDDWGARTLADVADDTAPDDVERTLEIVCDSYATGVLGTQMCGQSIAAVMRYLTSSGVTPRTQALADAAAGAMENFGRDEWALGCEPPESQPAFTSGLDTLLALGFESAPVLSAFARVAPCGERLQTLQRAVELAPQDGDLVWRLGGAYASDGRWDEALTAYRRAKSLPTIVPKFAIDEEIRTTEQRIAAR
jgi:tetratricopeptide (TPR) repeat protein